MIADLCLRTTEYDKSLELGRELGLGLICFVVPIEEVSKARKLIEKRDHRLRPKVAVGTEIALKNSNLVRKEVLKVRKEVDVVVASGGTAELNRAIVDTPEVDILINHEISGRPGINYVLARIARKNNVSIGFDLNRLISSYRLGRIQGFSSMTESAKQARKFKAPFVLTSGGLGPWDLRSGSELLAFGRGLGFSESESKKAISWEIVRENRKRLGKNWVMPGVEIE